MKVKPPIKKIFDVKDISSMVKHLAGNISRDYRDKNPVTVCVLKGSFIFLADLARAMDIDFRIDFMRISSYRNGEDNEQIILVNDIVEDITNEHVIIVEDIVDTGYSLKYLKEHLLLKKPASVSCCALIDKRERRDCEYGIEYPGFRIDSGFVVGYGMDYKGWGRNFSEIYVIE